MQILWGIGMFAVAVGIHCPRTDGPSYRAVLGARHQVLFVIIKAVEPGKQARSRRDSVKTSIRPEGTTSSSVLSCLEGTVVAFQVLPVIVFVASLTAVLYHWNILQWVVRIIGGGLQKVLGTSKPESLNATANIFLGQTEAPLLVRPYLPNMTRSEFFAVMVGGLATVAGSVMVLYR